MEETRTITTRDKKWFYQYLDTEDEVNEVCKYLEDNGLTIKVDETHDPQSGWYGQHVYLEGIDLSTNGYKFDGSALLYHVRTFKEYEKIKNSDEYKLFVELRQKYKDIYKFFNKYDF